MIVEICFTDFMPWPLVHLERTCFALHHVPVAFNAMVSEGDKVVRWFAHYAVSCSAGVGAGTSKSRPQIVCATLPIEQIDRAAVTYKALSRFAHDFGIVPFLLKEPELFG